MKEKLDLIKSKKYTELSEAEIGIVSEITKKFDLSLNQINIVFTSFLFDDTIEQAFKKIIQ